MGSGQFRWGLHAKVLVVPNGRLSWGREGMRDDVGGWMVDLMHVVVSGWSGWVLTCMRPADFG